MLEQRKPFHSHIISRVLAIGLTILPYGLVTACGAFAVAVVANTSSSVITMKLDSVIRALKRR